MIKNSLIYTATAFVFVILAIYSILLGSAFVTADMKYLDILKIFSHSDEFRFIIL